MLIPLAVWASLLSSFYYGFCNSHDFITQIIGWITIFSSVCQTSNDFMFSFMYITLTYLGICFGMVLGYYVVYESIALSIIVAIMLPIVLLYIIEKLPTTGCPASDGYLGLLCIPIVIVTEIGYIRSFISFFF